MRSFLFNLEGKMPLSYLFAVTSNLIFIRKIENFEFFEKNGNFGNVMVSPLEFEAMSFGPRQA